MKTRRFMESRRSLLKKNAWIIWLGGGLDTFNTGWCFPVVPPPRPARVNGEVWTLGKLLRLWLGYLGFLHVVVVHAGDIIALQRAGKCRIDRKQVVVVLSTTWNQLSKKRPAASVRNTTLSMCSVKALQQTMERVMSFILVHSLGYLTQASQQTFVLPFLSSTFTKNYLF